MATTQRIGTLLLISRLSKRAQRATTEAEMGMSMRHYMALWVIPGSISQAEFAEQMCIDANNTSILLGELEAKGWVVRERDPADRRRHLVRITEAGRDAVERAVEAREPYEDAILSALDPGERRTLHALIVKALDEGG